MQNPVFISVHVPVPEYVTRYVTRIDWNEFVPEDFIFVHLSDNFSFKKLCVLMFFPKKMLPVGNGMFKEIISHQIDSGKKMNFH